MKTKAIIIAAAAFIISISGLFANPTKTTLTFFDANGRTLIQPIMGEETCEELPFEVAIVFQSIRTESAYRVYDLSEMSMPETEEEVPFDLKKVFQEAFRNK